MSAKVVKVSKRVSKKPVLEKKRQSKTVKKTLKRTRAERCRHWSITLNNPDEHQGDFDMLLDYGFRYCIFSFEHHDEEESGDENEEQISKAAKAEPTEPTEFVEREQQNDPTVKSNKKTPHIQGYMETWSEITRRTLSKEIGLSWHIEEVNVKGGKSGKRTRKWAQNFLYCTKERGEFYEFGESITQGARTDLHVIQRLYDLGADEKQIAQRFFSRWTVYRRSFKRYQHMQAQPVESVNIVDLDVPVENIIDAYGNDNCYVCGNFDHKMYRGEPNIIILGEIVNDEDMIAYKISRKQSHYYPARCIYIRPSAFCTRICDFKASENPMLK